MNHWYANLLTDHRWLAKRKERLAVDGYKCLNCSKGLNQVTLVVHHIGYIFGFLPWDYPLNMLATLCIGCHNDVHDGSKPQFFCCHYCKEIAPAEEANGRDGKHEWICEKCIQEEAESIKEPLQ